MLIWKIQLGNRPILLSDYWNFRLWYVIHACRISMCCSIVPMILFISVCLLYRWPWLLCQGMDISFGSTVGYVDLLGCCLNRMSSSAGDSINFLSRYFMWVVNASLILYTKVNPLVITLGTMYLFGGRALLLSGFAGATGYEGIGGFWSLLEFANQTLFGIPTLIIYFFIDDAGLWYWCINHYWTQYFLNWAEEWTSVIVPCRSQVHYIIYSAIGVGQRLWDFVSVLFWLCAFWSWQFSLNARLELSVVLGRDIYGGSGSS